MQQKFSALNRGLPDGNIDSWMIKTRGRTSGFDYLRLFLACLVILAHSRVVTYGLAAVTPAGAALVGHPPLIQPILWSVVPAFFVISGFLVAGSLMRVKTVLEFGMLRALRLVPALLMETLIAAFIVGPMVTDLPLSAYFSAAALWSYPLNIVGDIHYVLPGVFTHNAAANAVNVQLWTIPLEILCYVGLACVFALVGWISRTWPLKLKTAIGLTALGIFVVVLASLMRPHGMPQSWRGGAHTPTYATLLLCYVTGIAACFYQGRIPLRLSLAMVALAATYIAMYDGEWQYLGVIPLAYATIYCGMSNFPKLPFILSGDYSYGIYLYGYPVQQTFAYLFPHNPYWGLNFIVSLAVSAAIAVLSWHFIESRVLANRKPIIAAVQSLMRSPVLSWRSS